jgi:hypothetical protein
LRKAALLEPAQDGRCQDFMAKLGGVLTKYFQGVFGNLNRDWLCHDGNLAETEKRSNPLVACHGSGVSSLRLGLVLAPDISK